MAIQLPNRTAAPVAIFIHIMGLALGETLARQRTCRGGGAGLWGKWRQRQGRRGAAAGRPRRAQDLLYPVLEYLQAGSSPLRWVASTVSPQCCHVDPVMLAQAGGKQR